ncbi:MAG TPA: hypothetical protein VEY71_12250 [Chitinophagales bacterium]|nr:hypothetical protein [Chitinophagales bacterium]
MRLLFFALTLISTNAFAQQSPPSDSLVRPGEKHFKNLRQLTFGGDNAEAYFSFAGDKLVFQYANHKDVPCDQIYYSDIPKTTAQPFQYNRISNGKGRTTCSYFLPGDSLVLYASTHAAADSCPTPPGRSKIKKYVWGVFPDFEIYVSDLNGNIKTQLTKNKFYDAEATVSPKGDKILFTSDRDGDLDLYTMNIDGSSVKRITTKLGYDGGAFFSHDGSQIVWRASRPKTDSAIAEYKDLLSKGLVAPTNMHLFVANADGSNQRQVTNLPNASWAPFFHPSGKKIIFASNHEHKRGYPFNLYLINTDGTGLERITSSDMFDAFPMFSPDGKYLVFSSNRNNGGTRDTNIFIAEWAE